MRKIIVYIAVSADGFIARPDGDIAWLDRPRPKGNYGMAAFYKSIDTVLMGRKTYDVALSFGQQSYAGKKNYIFSRSPRPSQIADLEFTDQPVGDFVKQFRSIEGKDVWLVGGGDLIAAFLDEGLVDEFMIHVVPTFIGEGLPLVAPRHRSIELSLLKTKRYSDGIVLLHYLVIR